MGSSEKFCLRWNDFQENISVAFRDLRNDSDFFDVTLACSDESSVNNSAGSEASRPPTHKTVRAHKVILSSCSIFFKDLLRSMTVAGSNVQPLIFLRGIRFEDLQSILDFMYFGEVNIEQEKLNTFLAVAEELRVKGLSQNEATTGGGGRQTLGETASPAKRPLLSNKNSPNFGAKKARIVKRAKDEGTAVADIKTEMRETSPEPKDDFGGEGSSRHRQFSAADIGDRSLDEFGAADSYLDQVNDGAPGAGGDADGNVKEYFGGGAGHEDADYDYEQEAEVLIEEGEEEVNRFVDRPDYRSKIRQLIKFDSATNQPYCAICNQSGSSFETISNHVEARHIQRREYPCQYCGKAFKTKNHKAVHIHRVHREEHKLAKVFGGPPELN